MVFDLPNKKSTQRARLRRYLRSHAFGYLQKSVWITPDPMHNEGEVLAGGKTNVESLILLEVRPCAGKTDAQIVAGAWDFERINRSYAECIAILDQRPTGALRDNATAKGFQRWAAAEHTTWLAAVSLDPLLPEPLLPQAYLGHQTWRKRIELLRQASQQVRTFSD